MEEEFDESLDAICTQVPIDLAGPKIEPKKNEFKIPGAPVYTFNRQQKSNQNGPIEQQFDLNQRSNKNVINQPNKSNTFNQSKFNATTNQTNNQLNRSNQPLKANQFNNQNKSHFADNKQIAKSNPFTKTFLPDQPKSKINQTSTITGKGSFDNLAKSVLAQNRSSIYSVNKQNLTIKNNQTINQQSLAQSAKQINLNSSKNIATRNTQSSDHSQVSVIFSTQQNANHSSFEISDNLTANLSVKLTPKEFDFHPEDSYFGELHTLKMDLKKKNEKISKLEDLIKEKDRKLNEEMKNHRRQIEKLETDLDFNNSRIISEEFKEAISTQSIRESPNINKDAKKKVLIVNKLPSPRKKLKNQLLNESIKISQFNSNNLSMFDENFTIPDTQPISHHSSHTQIDNLSEFNKLNDSLMEESDDECYIPGTQFCDTIIPETQVSSSKNNYNEIDNKKQTFKRKSNELKRIKIESSVIERSIEKQSTIFHELHFKFIDFQIYDNLFDEKRMNFIRDNINSNFDQIIERIINLQLYTQLTDYEFKFLKLDESFILALLYLDLETNIPELMFNLLTNLQQYKVYLQDKELIPKLTKKCFIWKEYVRCKVLDTDGRTLFNRIAMIFSSCRSLNENQDSSNDYLRLCYSIITFLNENIVEQNSISEFHNFTQCKCWTELHSVLGQFALYLLEIYEPDNILHQLIIKDLTKFILYLYRSKSLSKGKMNFARFSYLAQKIPENYNYLEYLSI